MLALGLLSAASPRIASVLPLVAYTSLLPCQVRERRFKPAGLGRRGLEPADVYAFLDRVAGDLAAVYAALADSRREAARIKDALRRWQSDQARTANGERR